MTPRKPHRRASGGTPPPRPPARGAPAAPSTAPATEPAAEPAAPAGSSPPAEPSVLKAKAADDDPRVWGDSPEDRDSWLLEQRPPHWD
ncbi:hypothetical protein QNO08_13580 [Arthrobacter sp. zg-Y820]|uniref:hypothetical protein n=1 Tax=unclassified Arthrobacter TaxID=235627 RepID=UPI001E6494F0|nr:MULTISPECIES: hypothetical protein [unclassified Arthrobacter]MCC9195860.1 hypothetical protein [Arthrobacter sp. zg-Y820]MDK1278720.1 hypothetical protein [Arthrobacter sp. zg.Y820]WIB08855.1 hypothetical protein QNO08_13580 [Arthrobacter sp. zg-Y820]